MLSEFHISINKQDSLRGHHFYLDPEKRSLQVQEKASPMAAATELLESLSRAFSGGGGIGVDEKAMITVLGKLHPQEKDGLRRGSWRDFFVEDEREFQRWEDRYILHLEKEFLRLKDAIVLWTMHPWERDARFLKEALHHGHLGEEPQYDLLIEIACTRSSDELLGARRAYHSLCHRSVEEDVADSRIPIPNPERKTLVALLSAYRYQGAKVEHETAKDEAKAILAGIQGKGNGQGDSNDQIVRILSTRSKLHLQALYKHYKEISGNYLDEDLDGYLRQTVECLCAPHKYFTKILHSSMELESDERDKQGLTRVIVTRADSDMELIKKEYNEKYGVDLSARVGEVANGNYRDFLVALIARTGC